MDWFIALAVFFIGVVLSFLGAALLNDGGFILGKLFYKSK